MKKFRIVVVVLILAGLAVFYYFHLTNKTSERSSIESTEELSENDKLLQYDFEEDYPISARDVVKLHCRYLKTMYSGIDEDTIKQLNKQVRNLYSSELIDANNEDAQTAALIDEINQCNASSMSLTSYVVAEQSQMQSFTKDGKEYVALEVTCYVKVDTTGTKMYEKYVLVKENEQWKIYGWQQTGLNTNNN